jgi:hypothetical protein
MNRSKAIRAVAIAGAALAATAAGAHPNHADPGTTTTLLHLLTEPDHVLMILGAVGVGIAAVRMGRRAGRGRRDRQE